uniref:Uncharacterized protein n=1 Tax=Syphacia muris TaxID=451379 RepID=A0A0N5AMD3_9BILA
MNELLVLSALLITASARFLSDPKGIEVNVPKLEDGEEEFEGIGGVLGETPKLGSFPEEPRYLEANYELTSTQEKPKLQPNDEFVVGVAAVNEQQGDDVKNEGFVPLPTEKNGPNVVDCIPRYLVEDKLDKSSEESVAKDVVEDSLSPVLSTVETSTFSRVTDANMIEEPFKKIYVRPLCDD